MRLVRLEVAHFQHRADFVKLLTSLDRKLLPIADKGTDVFVRGIPMRAIVGATNWHASVCGPRSMEASFYAIR